MMTLLYISLVVYLLFVFIIVVVGYLAQRVREGNYGGDPEDHIDISDLSVIIPFRNEEQRIDSLLSSIKKLNYLPKEFVFVDDHSEDETVVLIQKLPSEIPFRILELNNKQEGKKMAIRVAINQIDSKYILTVDADVEIGSDYFLHLARLKNADMYILPAIMQAKRWWQYLFEVDLVLVMAINAGLSGLARPILASGGNLFFSRKAFEKHDRFESHQHMPSGDDIYLLRDFRNVKADVRLHTSSSLSIHTETPQTFKEFLHQRLRWVAKTGDVKDYLSTVLAIIQAILTGVFVFFLLYFLLRGESTISLLIFIGKTAIDLLAFLPFFNRSQRLITWMFIPIYEVLFPIYSFVLLILMYFFKPTWKGRKLNRNF